MESKVYSLNKADPLKRLAAWFLDMILIVTIAVGFMVLTSVVIGYDKEQAKLTVVRRTCGYLGENFWNVGKTKEIKARVLHL